MDTTDEPNSEAVPATAGHAVTRRSAGVAAALHARSGHPFLTWLGTQSLAAWIASRDDLRGRVTRSTVQAWISWRNAAPEWWVDYARQVTSGRVTGVAWKVRSTVRAAKPATHSKPAESL